VDLLQTKEFICRAWDSSMNTQPMNFTWNLMGMMNNYAYKVKVGIMIDFTALPNPAPSVLLTTCATSQMSGVHSERFVGCLL